MNVRSAMYTEDKKNSDYKVHLPETILKAVLKSMQLQIFLKLQLITDSVLLELLSSFQGTLLCLFMGQPFF